MGPEGFGVLHRGSHGDDGGDGAERHAVLLVALAQGGRVLKLDGGKGCELVCRDRQGLVLRCGAAERGNHVENGFGIGGLDERVEFLTGRDGGALDDAVSDEIPGWAADICFDIVDAADSGALFDPDAAIGSDGAGVGHLGGDVPAGRRLVRGHGDADVNPLGLGVACAAVEGGGTDGELVDLLVQ